MFLLELLQAMSNSWLIFLHFTGHKDETIKSDALADNRNVLDGFFEDYINMAMMARFICVAYPPEIQPVSVKL